MKIDTRRGIILKCMEPHEGGLPVTSDLGHLFHLTCEDARSISVMLSGYGDPVCRLLPGVTFHSPDGIEFGRYGSGTEVFRIENGSDFRQSLFLFVGETAMAERRRTEVEERDALRVAVENIMKEIVALEELYCRTKHRKFAADLALMRSRCEFYLAEAEK